MIPGKFDTSKQMTLDALASTYMHAGIWNKDDVNGILFNGNRYDRGIQWEIA